jgi:pimeloyl-ACP methyl ester carboxylesterase/predicted Ser/Thr protein kinase
MEQTIRFCTAPDGVRLAYATSGSGPPLVKTANWLTHLEFDWESPVWRHIFRALSSHHLLLRYDDRGNGLSDWECGDISFDAWVRDLETVVDAAGLERFALLGISRGGAVSIEYAARHPERVSHLILLGAFARGWSHRSSDGDIAVRQAMVTLMREGWGQDHPAFRQLWTSCFVPDGTLEHQRWFNELQRMTTSAENAVRMQRVSSEVDVTGRLAGLRVPTLVLHARGDVIARFDHGRRLAASIPGATFVPLDSRNHLLLEDEPAFGVFLREVRRFLGVGSASVPVADASRDSASLAPGEMLGHYRVLGSLGRGGMGEVFRARDTKLGRNVALKVLSPSIASGDAARRWLLREARHAAALNHPNVCTIHDVVEAGGRDVIVMEEVSGVPLRDALSGGPLPADRVRTLGAQVAEAVAHAHDRGVIHGDLKSGNIMVGPGDRVKVLDFGVSRRMAGPEGATATDLSLAAQAQVGGTPAYMAPEILRGDATDPRSDLWSIGVLLYEMATGALPFAAAGLYDLITAVLEREVDVPRAVDPGLADVIRKCLERDVRRRYQTGAEVRDALSVER